MTKCAAADVVIFGGGIAGLWLLNRLQSTGLSAILFESGSLGGGQTHKSQGIIHGGLKYALQGKLTNESQVLFQMPDLWRHCLKGSGEIDLSNVPILSHQHVLWSPNKFTSKLAGLFAIATLSTKVTHLEKTQFPSVLQNPAFKGDVFSLDEIVIDVPILIRELVKASQDAVFKIEPLNGEELKFDKQKKLVSATVYFSGKSVEVKAQQFIFTAGTGNELILKKLNHQEIAMQRRPLHMVLAKVPFNHALYGHCVGLGPRPRLTITTHHAQDGSTIWYLGGQLAEEGVNRDPFNQIKVARAELQALFPWLDFSTAEFTTFLIDRAEPLQKNNLKPDSACLKVIKNMMVGWPTKLALAPVLAEEIVMQLQKLSIQPAFSDIRELRSWPIPPLAMPIWEDVFCKSVA